VREAMNRKAEFIAKDMKLEDIKDFVYMKDFKSFPVVDTQGLCGILSVSDCQRALEKGDLSLTANEIATRKVVTVTQEDTLFSALDKFTKGDFAILPVVDLGDPKKLLGVISRSDIMSAINDAVTKKRSRVG
jgi:CIC family chloride channel protein